MTKDRVLAAQRVLMDNGIDVGETDVIIEALGYILMDEDWEDLVEWDSSKIPYEQSIWE